MKAGNSHFEKLLLNFAALPRASVYQPPPPPTPTANLYPDNRPCLSSSFFGYHHFTLSYLLCLPSWKDTLTPLLRSPDSEFLGSQPCWGLGLCRSISFPHPSCYQGWGEGLRPRRRTQLFQLVKVNRVNSKASPPRNFCRLQARFITRK